MRMALPAGEFVRVDKRGEGVSGKKGTFVRGGGVHIRELIRHPGVEGAQVLMKGGELGCV